MRTLDTTVSGHQGCASENPSIQCLAEYPYMGNREGTSGGVAPPYLPLQTTILFSRSKWKVEGRKVPLPPALKVNRECGLACLTRPHNRRYEFQQVRWWPRCNFRIIKFWTLFAFTALFIPDKRERCESRFLFTAEDLHPFDPHLISASKCWYLDCKERPPGFIMIGHGAIFNQFFTDSACLGTNNTRTYKPPYLR